MSESAARDTPKVAMAKFVRALSVYFAVVLGIGLGVWFVTGSAIDGALTSLGLLIALPWVATALRIAHQKRAGLPVRGYWDARPPS